MVDLTDPICSVDHVGRVCYQEERFEYGNELELIKEEDYEHSNHESRCACLFRGIFVYLGEESFSVDLKHKNKMLKTFLSNYCGGR
jgi:hypothetical protein